MRSKLLLLSVSTCLMLVLAELTLRYIVGIQPGQCYHNPWFAPVSELKTYHGFISDSNGIFKVERLAAEKIAKRIQEYNANKNLLGPQQPLPDEVHEIYSLVDDYVPLSDPNFHNTFSDFVRKIKNKPISEMGDLDSAILYYTGHPINADGFKSIAFKNYKQGKKKLLLIGDSFAWGHSTETKTNCFADLLLTKGYVVYNTGISGADPSQYLAVAEHYIPLLKPDVVIVNFYLGNDVFYFNRIPMPGIPIFYSTNAGNLYSCKDGVLLTTPDQAYQQALNTVNIPVENSYFNRICATTSVTTAFWKVCERLKWVDGYNTADSVYWEAANKVWQDKPYCNVQMEMIRSVTERYGSEFYLVAIPDYLYGNENPEDIDCLFENMKYYVADVSETKGYNHEDGHFNDEGHKEYADFLEMVMSGKISPKKKQ